MSESHTVSFRISERQFNDIRYLAEYSLCTVSSIGREAFRLYCKKAAYLKILNRILDNSKIGDTQLIAFPGSRNQQESKNRIKIYVHTMAFGDLKNLGQSVENDVMEFLHSSARDNSLLNKGQITTTDDGLNFICFTVNLVKVYCQFSPMQITVLHVSK